jgi:hypothetical protein
MMAIKLKEILPPKEILSPKEREQIRRQQQKRILKQVGIPMAKQKRDILRTVRARTKIFLTEELPEIVEKEVEKGIEKGKKKLKEYEFGME